MGGMVLLRYEVEYQNGNINGRGAFYDADGACHVALRPSAGPDSVIIHSHRKQL